MKSTTAENSTILNLASEVIAVLYKKGVFSINAGKLPGMFENSDDRFVDQQNVYLLGTASGTKME